MPPANSPNGPSGSPLPPLSYLESPAPDLASTLQTHTQEEAARADPRWVTYQRRDGQIRHIHPEEPHSAPGQPRERDSLLPPNLRALLDEQDSSSPPGLLSTRSSASDLEVEALMQGADEPIGTASPPLHARDSSDDLTRRERLQRVMARLNRLPDPTSGSGGPATQATSAAYGDRPPSPARQSLYDWAPAYTEAVQDEAELEGILSDLRQHQPPGSDPAVMRIMARAEMIRRRGAARESERHRETTPSGTGDTTAEARRRRERERFNLRRGAVLQRARQEGSPSATDRMLRYVMERERSGMNEEEERAQRQGWIGGPTDWAASGHARSESNDLVRENERRERIRRERDRQERVAAFRRGYQAETGYPRLPRIASPPLPADHTAPPAPTSATSSSHLLENALKYLSDLRECTSYSESISVAVEHRMASREHFVDQQEDFIMDLDRINPLAVSSWLRPGATFEGHQHATNHIVGNLTHRRQGTRDHNVEQINPHYSRFTSMHGSGESMAVQEDADVGLSGFDLPGALPPLEYSVAAQNTPRSHSKPDTSHFDQWPVRFTLHSVDSEAMTLKGTMEAYDVPQHTGPLSTPANLLNDPPRAGKKAAPITTYVEGHIIDLRTHSFLTPMSSRFDASPLDRYEEAIRGGVRPRSPGHPYTVAPQNAQPYNTHATAVPFPAATATTDASNWAHLPPFSEMRPPPDPNAPWAPAHPSPANLDTIASTLLSTSAVNQLMDDYIFMRWKERCFVHSKDEKCEFQTTSRGRNGGGPGHSGEGIFEEGDQDRGHGLTISGFYYVSLRRSDGRIEGLYFDPASTPHQVLRLEGGRMGASGVGAWGFQ